LVEAAQPMSLLGTGTASGGTHGDIDERGAGTFKPLDGGILEIVSTILCHPDIESQ